MYTICFLMELSLIITVFKFPFIFFSFFAGAKNGIKGPLVVIMPSEISQIKKEKHYIISFICGIF